MKKTHWHAGVGIAVASALGGTTRALLTSPVINDANQFPWDVLLINLTGCALIGILAGLLTGRTARLILLTGFCGGFTTFSAFGLDTVILMQIRPVAGLLYIVSTLGGAIVLTALGSMAAAVLRPRQGSTD